MNKTNSQSGITMIETMFAAFILVVGSLGMIGLIVKSIATNNRNRLDSTQMMLATSLAEQIDSTIIGSGSSSLVDCGGVSHTIDTSATVGGAKLNTSTAHSAGDTNGDAIDFAENISADTTKNNYHMDYTLRTPCDSTGTLQGTYDVRWHIDIIGSSTGSDTNTYLLTIGARLKDHGEGNLFFAAPVSVRVLSGN